MSKGWCLGDVGFASEACSLSQRPHMNFHDFHVISAHTGLASPVSIGALLFSDSLFSCPGRASVIHRLTAAKMGGGGGAITVQKLSSSGSLQLFMSPKHWEAVICIYIRSLDQARGLLALGVLCARVPSPLTLDMHPQATYVLPVLIHGVCQLQNCHAVSLFLTLLF